MDLVWILDGYLDYNCSLKSLLFFDYVIRFLEANVSFVLRDTSLFNNIYIMYN